MKKISPILLSLIIILAGCAQETSKSAIQDEGSPKQAYEYLESHTLVTSARKQIGVVTQYDTEYYQGGYPPENKGACTDVIEQALRDNGYNLVSDKTRRATNDRTVRVPLLIHNYGFGVVEDDKLLRWPAPITGHYRIPEII